MNKNIKYTLQTLSVIAIVVAALWLKKSFWHVRQSPDNYSTKDTAITIVRYIDSSTHTINQVSEIKYYSRPSQVKTGIDTQAVLKKYYSRRFTQNSFRDSNLSNTVYDTLLENAIAGRSLDYKILKPNSVVTRTITKQGNAMYVGAGYSPAAGVYPNISYAFKNWQVGAGIGQVNKQATAFFNLQYKIR